MENKNDNTDSPKMDRGTRLLVLFNGVIAAATAAVAVYTAVSLSDQGHFNSQQITRMDSQYREQRRYDSVQIKSDNIRRVSDSIATVKQDAFTRATLDSTGKQIEIAREAMRKELRPYVGLKRFIYNAAGDIDSLVFGNVGRTPAYDLSFKAHDTLAPYPTHKLNPLSTSSSLSAVTLSPGAEGTMPLHSHPWELDSIKSGRMAFYRWAIATYSDIFGIEHFTKVRIAERFANGHLYFTIPKEGNEYDKN